MATDVMEQMRVAFRAEALDLLIEPDSALLALEGAPLDSTLVNRVFRAIHTIKSSGATAGFTHLAKFAHHMEEAFDLARGGRLAVTPDLIDCGLKACDIARLVIEDAVEGTVVPGELEVTGAFARLLPASEPTVAQRPDQSKPPAEVRCAFEIVFKPNREMFYSGADPVTLLDDLRGAHHRSCRPDITLAFDRAGALLSLVGDPSHHRPRSGGHQGRLRLCRGRLRVAHPVAGRPDRDGCAAWFGAGRRIRIIRPRVRRTPGRN